MTNTKRDGSIQITKQTRPNYTRLPNRVQAVRKPIGNREHEAWSKQELDEKQEVWSDGILRKKKTFDISVMMSESFRQEEPFHLEK